MEKNKTQDDLGGIVAFIGNRLIDGKPFEVQWTLPDYDKVLDELLKEKINDLLNVIEKIDNIYLTGEETVS